MGQFFSSGYGYGFVCPLDTLSTAIPSCNNVKSPKGRTRRLPPPPPSLKGVPRDPPALARPSHVHRAKLQVRGARALLYPALRDTTDSRLLASTAIRGFCSGAAVAIHPPRSRSPPQRSRSIDIADTMLSYFNSRNYVIN
jgi:hypothetical protein